MRIFYFLIFLATLPFTTLQAQFIDWQSKVHPKVLEAAPFGPTECIILMNEQADVSEAKALRTKIEKGNFVYKKLAETALHSQKNVVAILSQNRVNFMAFKVVNAVACKLDWNTLQAIAALPEVAQILHNPKVKVEDDVRLEDGEDPGRSTEWGLKKINADDVWVLSGNPKGQGVVVGGQDTGYKWDHEQIKLKYRGWNNTNSTSNHNYNWHDAIHQIDVHNSGNNPCGLSITVPCDDDEHGTHTMGTMVGGIPGDTIGVAPSAKWIGCRNMERGWGTPTTYTECFDWFLAPTDTLNQNADPSKAPDVINNSWGCPSGEGCTDTGTYTLMKLAVNNLKAAGVVVVVSAGNSGDACSSVNTAAAIFTNSFTVGATASNDGIASWSSRGPALQYGNVIKPNVSAPGVSVRSCVPTGYKSLSGTSMAGPHVAGSVALLISAKPSIQGNVDYIEDILEQSAVDLTSSENCGGVSGSNIPNNTFGHGRIDILAAVNQSLPIKLINFYGLKEKSQNHLYWTTGLEVNAGKFVIERAIDNNIFEKVGEVKAYGFSVGEINYEFVDPIRQNGSYYYRLRQVDLDGFEELSRIVILSRNDLANLQIGPNPTSGNLRVAINVESASDNDLKIYNMSGQLISEYPLNLLKGFNDFTLDLQGLATGVYRLILAGSNGLILNEKIVISR